MDPMQQPLNSRPEFEVSLEEATIRSCSLRDGKLDVTLTNNLRLEFSPTHFGVTRYLYVVENHPLGVLPSNFVEKIELLLREGLLGEPKLIALSE